MNSKRLKAGGWTLFAALGVAYTAANVYVARNFWFWWDEISVTASQSGPLRGMLYSHIGNWFPLGRLVYAIETGIFGDSYGWYVAVNCVLLLAICGFVFEQLRMFSMATQGRATWRLLIPIALLVSYAVSAGNLYNAQWGYQVAWFLSVLTVVAGTWILTRFNLSFWWYFAVLAIAMLFFASHIVSIGLTGLALLLLNRKPVDDSTEQNSPSTSRSLVDHLRSTRGQVAATLVVSGFLLGVAYIAAKAFPPPDTSLNGTDIKWDYLLQQPTRFFRLLLAAIVNWVITPFSGTTNSFEPRAIAHGNWFAAHSWIALALLIVVAAIIIFLASPKQSTIDIRLPVGLLVLALLVFQVTVTIRGFGGLESSVLRRYDPSLLLTITILWALLTMSPIRTLLGKFVQGAVIALIAITTIWSLWNFPSAVRNASFHQRITEADAVNAALSQCTPNNEFPPFISIQAPIRGDVCNLWLRFHHQRN